MPPPCWQSHTAQFGQVTRAVLLGRFDFTGWVRQAFTRDAEDDAAAAALSAECGTDVARVWDAYDAVATNWMKVRGTLKGGMYDRLGRVNHSCEPTAELQVVDSAAGTLKLVALRDVAAGEQLTYSYYGSELVIGLVAFFFYKKKKVVNGCAQLRGKDRASGCGGCHAARARGSACSRTGSQSYTRLGS